MIGSTDVTPPTGAAPPTDASTDPLTDGDASDSARTKAVGSLVADAQSVLAKRVALCELAARRQLLAQAAEARQQRHAMGAWMGAGH